MPVSLHFRASAKNAFFLFIDFDLSLTLANIGLSKDFSLIFVHYIGNSDDIETCKTYIRVIHKYLPDASPSQVQNILVVELNWTSKDAAEVGELLQRLKDGGRFVGGQKTNLKEYYNRWKEKQ